MKRVLALAVLAFLPVMTLHAQSQSQSQTGENKTPATAPGLATAMHHPNASPNGMVVAEERLAASVGAKILAQGGNAVDATVATAFALAVTFPRAGNIAGGGFMLIHMKQTNETVALDYREMAPSRASADMYLDEAGEVIPEASLFTHKAAGVPGTVAGLLFAQEKYGRLSRKAVMAPAIKLAEKGYPLSYFNIAMTEGHKDVLSKNPAAAAEFFKADGTNYQPGETYKRKDLARTLKKISRDGKAGFYEGEIARLIADEMRTNGGLVTQDDLANYSIKVRQPVQGTYRGYDIYSMPPPSSGGIHLIQMLNMLEELLPDDAHMQSAEAYHVVSEAMRSAYADRAQHLGDPDYVDVPQAGLISKSYAKKLTAGVSAQAARKSSNVGAGNPRDFNESPETTQISVIDRDGNMVSNTYTLNLSFGSGIVVPGTGILLNNEMDDFASAPGVPNAYGLIGSDSNAIEAGKRPLSSMTPTLIFKNGEPFLVAGAPGGARIITSVLQVILNIIDGGMNIADAVDAPRIHHQWVPDILGYEPGVGPDTRKILEEKGHIVQPMEWYARPQLVQWKDGWAYGYADTRMPGGRACSPDTPC